MIDLSLRAVGAYHVVLADGEPFASVHRVGDVWEVRRHRAEPGVIVGYRPDQSAAFTLAAGLVTT